MVAKSFKLNSSEFDTDEEMTTMNEDDKRKVDTSTRNIQAKGSGHTDFRSVVERINSVSKKVVSNNSELCELLDVSKVIHHQPLGSEVKELASRVLGSSKNLTPCMLLLRRGLPQVNHDISLFLMTIKKLCLGKKKLHAEVTARERLRILYEKGYSYVKNLDKNGAESSEIYEEKAEVKLQLSKASKSCVHMVEKGSVKVTQKVEEQIRIFRLPLRGYIDTHRSSVRALNEWLNRNTMEEDDQTETEAPEIFKVCSERLRETENVDERSWEKVSVLKQKVITRDDELELQNEVSIVIVVLLFAWAGQSRDSVYTILCVDKDEILRVGFPGASRGSKADPSKLERVEELKIGDWVRVKVPDSSISYGWSKPFSCSVIDIEKVVPFHEGQEIVEGLSAHVTDRETFWKVSPGDAEMLSVREISDWVRSYRSLGSRPSDDWFSVGKDNKISAPRLREFEDSKGVRVFGLSDGVGARLHQNLAL
ncbi:hypothetical protein F2Q69_00015630 [Brassica cretica]|uniref:DUF632 domain-containing protein n=1 Tax=Brassica cretica TaxID=69181 RepID=A0A8S9QNP2_BRACR|nr:hypothetical protein F2Q69_00015630 [Brassica cretica]